MEKLSIDMLMRLDREKVAEVPVKDIKANRLSQLMGQDVTVEIKALAGDIYMDLFATATNKKGNVDVSKTYRAQALIVVEAMQSPSLKDKELQVHFGAASPIDLAKTLFPGGELTKIFQEVADLSGFGDDEDEDLEEIKN
ncbi:hypothetical protein KHZ31_10200 [butyrate-producing bacterium]|nr:hypothetical protein [butyrate-producing bacterium]